MECREIQREGPPSYLDHAERGTRCWVRKDALSSDLYMQVSSDPDDPNWVYMGCYAPDKDIIPQFQ